MFMRLLRQVGFHIYAKRARPHGAIQHGRLNPADRLDLQAVPSKPYRILKG
jgi:hypothetical protein